jgi:hypothetical protein
MAEDTRILVRLEGAPEIARTTRRLRLRVRAVQVKAWLESHRLRLAVLFALVYLAFFVACLLTPSAWIDDSVYLALPWWSLVHRGLNVALMWMGARWLAQQMRMCP